MEQEKATCFYNGRSSVATSLKSFSIYDSTTFSSFFYSEFEKIWLLIVKNGTVVVDSKPVNRYTILNNGCDMQYETAAVHMTNLLGGIGFSHVLVEKFLISKNSLLRNDEIAEIASLYGNSEVALECLRRNKLFICKDSHWRLDYATYIRFLEKETDPLLDSVICEFECSALSKGISRTFSLHGIWDNDLFGGEQSQTLSASANTGLHNFKGITNWPHLRNFSQLGHQESVPRSTKASITESSDAVREDEEPFCRHLMPSPKSLDNFKNASSEQDESRNLSFEERNALRNENLARPPVKRKIDENFGKRTKFIYDMNSGPVIQKLPTFEPSLSKISTSRKVERQRSISSISFRGVDSSASIATNSLRKR